MKKKIKAFIYHFPLLGKFLRTLASIKKLSGDNQEMIIELNKLIAKQTKEISDLVKKVSDLERKEHHINEKCEYLRNRINNDKKNTDEKIDTKCEYLRNKINDNKKSLDEKIDTKCEYLRNKINDSKKSLDEKVDTKYEYLRNKINDDRQLMNKRIIETRDNAVIDITKNQKAYIHYMYYKGLHPSQYEENLKEWYYDKTGTTLNLEHPVTFNEKIQWLKLYDNTKLKTRLADKYLVREYIKEKIGKQYLIPLLGVYDNFDAINFEELPQKFVMKSNHASGWNIIVENKDSLDIEEARNKFKYWLGKNYAFNVGLELQYKNIVPKIIIEKYIDNGNNELFDYRFFCFSGKVHSIWVDVDSGKPTHKRNIYDLDWTLLPLTVNYPNDKELERKPQNFKKMIELAEILSEGFKFVRVDLYEVDGNIYFGEMTFTPQSGIGEWNPPEYNKLMGDLIILENQKDTSPEGEHK